MPALKFTPTHLINLLAKTLRRLNCPPRKLIQEYVDKSTFKIELENISQLFSNLNVNNNNNLIETIFDIANENAVNFELNLKKVLKESLEDQQKIYRTV